jgi:hypothetical protein
MLEEIISITKLEMDALDNQGFTYSPHTAEEKGRTTNIIYSLWELSWDFPRVAELETPESTHRSILDGKASEDVDEWISELMTSKGMNRIDSNGDTPLAAFLKVCRKSICSSFILEAVKKMVEGGADIHIRDREGWTPVAIAALHGLRPLVTFFLNAGGNSNVRRYTPDGFGILQQLELWFNMARMLEDEKSYAQYLSCYNALIDGGGKPRPTDDDEWMLPSARGSLFPSEDLQRAPTINSASRNQI